MECDYGYANTRISGVLVFACPKLLAMKASEKPCERGWVMACEEAHYIDANIG